ncbi:hypothetical protein E1B28_008108 [Marasmius oreades]|uniref:Hydrophobic surface binding protein n=1 Tax=Marasmius oreades TaxID=181124 RepID=A0A9P7RXW3_9AGAR|nr:uncharacterized protein E1B28_008108 [Marasmius oreades]KAG7091707.1 hypothetical protein E1B28_008108 [Marasmius oreades]
MARFFTIILPLLAAFSAAATPLKRTVAQIEADIAQITSQVAALDTAVKGFTNSLTQALAIHNDAVALVSTINQGTTDVNATPQPSESDSQTILNSVQGFVPSVTDALQAIIDKKAAFQALPIGGIPALVKQDLANLNTATVAFENGLIAKAPTDLKSQAQSIANTVNAALASAQAAYAQF